jgi:DNA-binding LacI/PurR family transcriptional regulator
MELNDPIMTHILLNDQPLRRYELPSKVTIATVARHANVSRQTVSNVLNTPEIVRPETRRRVKAAIEELGYRANLAARQMRTGRSRLLAVRIDPFRSVDGVVMDRFLHGFTQAAAPAGYRVVLYTADDDRDEIATYDELLASYALDAFVLTDTHHGDSRTAWLREHKVPFTTFGRPWGEDDDHSWVDVDGAAGTADATRHLLEAGHRRIGFLGWPEGSDVGDDRMRGWAEAMADAGLDVASNHRRSVDGFAEGLRGARELLAQRRAVTAVVCASDQLALGARQAGNIAVIGFDDTAMAQATELSSVRQPLADVAAECVRTLAELLDDHTGRAGHPAGQAQDRRGGPRQVLLKPTLVIRDSG